MKLKKLLLIAPLMLFAVNGQVSAQDKHRFDVPESNLFVPGRVATTGALRYDNGGFHLTLDSTERQVARYNVRGVPADVSEEKLEEALKFGYFTVAGSETEPMLQWQGRILGGMPGRNAPKKPTAGQMAALGAVAGAEAGIFLGPVGVAAGAAFGAAFGWLVS